MFQNQEDFFLFGNAWTIGAWIWNHFKLSFIPNSQKQ